MPPRHAHYIVECFQDHYDLKSPVALSCLGDSERGLAPFDLVVHDARGDKYLGAYCIGLDTDPETADSVPHVFVSVFADTTIYIHKIVASKLDQS